MRALISCSPGLPLLIILDRAIHGCSTEKRRTRSVLCVQDQCPNLPKSLERKREERKGKPVDPTMCLLEYFPIIYLLWLLERAKPHFYQLGAKVGRVNQTPPEHQLTLLSQQ